MKTIQLNSSFFYVKRNPSSNEMCPICHGNLNNRKYHIIAHKSLCSDGTERLSCQVHMECLKDLVNKERFKSICILCREPVDCTSIRDGFFTSKSIMQTVKNALAGYCLGIGGTAIISPLITMTLVPPSEILGVGLFLLTAKTATSVFSKIFEIQNRSSRDTDRFIGNVGVITGFFTGMWGIIAIEPLGGPKIGGPKRKLIPEWRNDPILAAMIKAQAERIETRMRENPPSIFCNIDYSDYNPFWFKNSTGNANIDAPNFGTFIDCCVNTEVKPFDQMISSGSNEPCCIITREDASIREEDTAESEELTSWGWGEEPPVITSGAGRLAPFWNGWKNPFCNLEQGALPFETLTGRLTDMPRALGEWQSGAKDVAIAASSQFVLGAVAIHLVKKTISWWHGRNSRDMHLNN